MTQPFQEFGPYRLTHLLGKGGMASVYRALKSGPMGFAKEVAIKRIHESLAGDDSILKSLINEARLGGQLRHPNIVEIYEFNKVGDAYYLAMEFVDGWTLDRVTKLSREYDDPLPAEVVLDILIQICEGLQYAHTLESLDGQEVKLVHRDLKPANIIVSRHGVAKVMDFGIAKADTNLFKTTMADVTKGTPHYMSPEQAAGEPNLGPASDIFALGSVVYELVTGRVLFRGDNLSTVLFAVVKAEVETHCAEIDRAVPGLGTVMARCLRRDPDERYPDAQSLQRDLKSLRHKLGEGTSVRDYLYRLRTAVLASQMGAEEQGTVTEAVPDFATLLDSRDGKAAKAAKERRSPSSDLLASMILAESGRSPATHLGGAGTSAPTSQAMALLGAESTDSPTVADPKDDQVTTRDHPPVAPHYASDEVRKTAPAKDAAPIPTPRLTPPGPKASTPKGKTARLKDGMAAKAPPPHRGMEPGQILALAGGLAILVIAVGIVLLRWPGDPGSDPVKDLTPGPPVAMDLTPVSPPTSVQPLPRATPPWPPAKDERAIAVTPRTEPPPPQGGQPTPAPVDPGPLTTAPTPAPPAPTPTPPTVAPITVVQGSNDAVTSGTLMVKKSTPWAWVWIDGRETGRQTPLQPLPLAAGKHRVELLSSDLQGRVAIDIDVQGGQRVVIDKYDFGTRSWTK